MLNINIIFIILGVLLEIERHRYKISFLNFYKNDLFYYIKSINNSIIFLINYGIYRYEVKSMSIHDYLIDNHDEIIGELEKVMEDYDLMNPGIFDSDFMQENDNYGYYFLKYFGNIETEILPTLKKVVKDNSKFYTCFISIMKGNINIPIHRGPYGGLLRYHYTLFSEDYKKDFLSIGGEKILWKEKTGFIFDDTYLHYVEKKSYGYRISIIIDIERELPFPLNRINRYILDKYSNFNDTKILQKLCIPILKPKIKFKD